MHTNRDLVNSEFHVRNRGYCDGGSMTLHHAAQLHSAVLRALSKRAHTDFFLDKYVCVTQLFPCLVLECTDVVAVERDVVKRSRQQVCVQNVCRILCPSRANVDVTDSHVSLRSLCADGSPCDAVRHLTHEY